MQLSIFELPEVDLIRKFETILSKDISKENCEIVETYKYESKVFRLIILIGKVKDRFDYSISYHFSSGNYNGLGLSFDFQDVDAWFISKLECLFNSLHFLEYKMNQVLKDLTANDTQKIEVKSIMEFIERIRKENNV